MRSWIGTLGYLLELLKLFFFISTRIPLTLILQSSAEEFGFRRCEYAKNFLGKSFLEKGKQ